MAIHFESAPAATLKIKRRPPRERVPYQNVSDWALSVEYQDGDTEHIVRLPLSTDNVALEVDVLLDIMRDPDPKIVRAAAVDLFVCLHNEWGQTNLVGRHPAWEAVFRFLAPYAVMKVEK